MYYEKYAPIILLQSKSGLFSPLSWYFIEQFIVIIFDFNFLAKFAFGSWLTLLRHYTIVVHTTLSTTNSKK